MFRGTDLPQSHHQHEIDHILFSKIIFVSEILHYSAYLSLCKLFLSLLKSFKCNLLHFLNYQ